ETRQGLFDVPTFITSITDNKKLRGKTAFCIKIYVKLMDVGYRHIAIKLRNVNTPKTRKFTFYCIGKFFDKITSKTSRYLIVPKIIGFGILIYNDSKGLCVYEVLQNVISNFLTHCFS
ncbi:hypothetical protein, partial [Bacillus cereus group sp. BfR-BA-01331]|uniref:hypothetical protein n=1 Tax=Bacillus cereus group sp. BfR-BA-01331 TaxID=2920307 RepID=UPI001F59C733